jgi:formiminotetrahydrofolate cyclodeaminase
MPVERTGVAVAASSASLALDLLSVVIEVSNPGQRDAWLAIARQESGNLRQAATEDVAAYNRYLACLRPPKATEAEQPPGTSQQDQQHALRAAIAIPLRAACSAAAGIDLCLNAKPSVRSSVAADLGVATELLAGAVRAMLLCVDANLRLLDPADPYLASVRAERRELEDRANGQAAAVLQEAALREAALRIAHPRVK